MKVKKEYFTLIVCILYLILLSWLILFKLATNPEMIPCMRNINLVPFAESVIVNGKIYLKEIIYNILAFVPSGVYISIIKKDWSLSKKAIVVFGLSLLFEITQYIFALGGSDITDLITNTLGGVLGIEVYSLFRRVFKEKSICIINIIGIVIEICAIGLLVLLVLAN